MKFIPPFKAGQDGDTEDNVYDSKGEFVCSGRSSLCHKQDRRLKYTAVRASSIAALLNDIYVNSPLELK